MRLGRVAARFVPAPIVTLIYWAKFRCFISPRAEVEVSNNLRIGPGTEIGSFTKIKASAGPLEIGPDVQIGTNCLIASGTAPSSIGRDCLISPHVVILATNYRYDRLDVPIRKQGQTSKGIRIGDNVWIGAGAVILDGAVIGDGVMIAPNSVVSSRVRPNTVVLGNPAKVIFERR